MRDFRITSAICTSLALVAVGTATHSAIAQPAAGVSAASTAERSGLEEIVVTAQKRNEKVQKVPIAITVFSTEELKSHTIQQMSDLQLESPGVTFNTTAQGNDSASIAIRGQKSTDVQLSIEQPTAVYVDGVYDATGLATQLDLSPDLDRIEILKGPQGTLYGRNAVGGAVNVWNKLPTDDYEGSVTLGFGDYNRVEAAAIVNVPVVPGKVDARFNLGYLQHDGWTTDLSNNRDLGDVQSETIRGTVLLKPIDAFEILLRGDYSKTTGGGAVIQGVYLTPGGPAALDIAAANGFIGQFFNPATAAAAGARAQAIFLGCGNGATPNFEPKCYAKGFEEFNKVQQMGGSITATYWLNDDTSIKSITALRRISTVNNQDYSATSVNILTANDDPYGNQLTQEVQFNGKAFDDKLNYATGAFYYYFTSRDGGVSQILTALQPPSANPGYTFAYHKDDSVGLYAQGTYALQDNVHFTGGVRWTTEAKELNDSIYNSGGPTFSCAVSSYPATTPLSKCFFDAHNSYRDTSYTFKLDWNYTDDILFYVSDAKGFLAGGINQRLTGAGASVPYTAFAPQIDTQYEIGVKGDFYDHRLRVNVAAYHTDVSDAQKATSEVLSNGSVVVATVNAASETLEGAEAEVTAIPFENFKILATAAYIHPSYDKFEIASAIGPLDISGTKFAQTPKWTFSVSPSYTVPLSFGALTGQVDYYWQSGEDLAPPITYPFPPAGDIHTQGAYALANLRVRLDVDAYNADISFWVKNLFDRRYFTGGLDVSASLGVAGYKVGDPRTFGFELTKRF